MTAIDAQTRKVQNDLLRVSQICESLISSLVGFEVANQEALPFGLKPHTRSVSWLVEQVLVQRLKVESDRLGITNVNYDWPDTALHDLSFDFNGETYYVNVKAHQSEKKANKNDISAVEKLFRAYLDDPTYNLFYAAFGIRFEERKVMFVDGDVHCFSPQFLPIYVNPRNDKIQAFYHHEPEVRTRKDFLDALVKNSKSIIL